MVSFKTFFVLLFILKLITATVTHNVPSYICMIVQLKRPDALIKDMYSVFLWLYSIFCRQWTRESTLSQTFQKIHNRLEKKGIKWKIITSSYKEIFSDRIYFMTSTLKKNSLLPTYMFVFNKWGLKINLIIPSTHFSQKMWKVKK